MLIRSCRIELVLDFVCACVDTKRVCDDVYEEYTSRKVCIQNLFIVIIIVVIIIIIYVYLSKHMLRATTMPGTLA